jgi:hypothetical protein
LIEPFLYSIHPEEGRALGSPKKITSFPPFAALQEKHQTDCPKDKSSQRTKGISGKTGFQSEKSGFFGNIRELAIQHRKLGKNPFTIGFGWF